MSVAAKKSVRFAFGRTMGKAIMMQMTCVAAPISRYR
jgi:hypothetical protein